MLIKAEDLGYVANVGPKLEYFYFVSGTEPKPIGPGADT